jgi:hypothetical protein
MVAGEEFCLPCAPVHPYAERLALSEAEGSRSAASPAYPGSIVPTPYSLLPKARFGKNPGNFSQRNRGYE